MFSTERIVYLKFTRQKEVVYIGGIEENLFGQNIENRGQW